MAGNDPAVYLDTIQRLEPDIAMIDPGAYYASAAISLRRMADAAERQAQAAADQLDILNAVYELLRRRFTG